MRTILTMMVLAIALALVQGCGVKGDPVPYVDAHPTPSHQKEGNKK